MSSTSSKQIISSFHNFVICKDGNGRKKYIDVVKGISIIAIVLLHFENGIFPSTINKWIGSFMVSSFYFTSGWLMAASLKGISAKEHIKRRVQTLVKPYLWFSLIFLIFTLVLVCLGFKQPKALLVDIYKTITLRGIGTLWFLPALLFGEAIFILIKNKSKKYIIAVIVGTFFYYVAYWEWSVIYGHCGEFYRIIDAPLRTVDNILKAWPVIAAGFYIKKILGPTFEESSKIQMAFLLIILAPVSFFVVNQLSLHLPAITVVVFVHPIASILCPLVVLLFAIITADFYLNRFFIFWGRNSLILMAIHYSIFLESSIIIHNYFARTEFVGISNFYYLIGTIILHYPIVSFFNAKARFMIGK